MSWQSNSFDWNQARAFLATAEKGSLSAAARVLSLTQPTLSRQVAALEEDLGVLLFERVGRSLQLTQTGRELLDHFRTMGEAAGRISLAASGHSQVIEGRVSISATDLMATYQLPAVLKKLRSIAPGVEIDVIARNDIQDLMRREADIAIRHVRPDQPDLVAKLIGEPAAYFYASTEYLDRLGRAKVTDDLSAIEFIGIDQSRDRLLYELTAQGIFVSQCRSRISTESGTVLFELVRKGFGVTALPEDIARLAPNLEKVWPELEPIRFPVWLVAHRELHKSRRLRVVYDLIAEELGEHRRR